MSISPATSSNPGAESSEQLRHSIRITAVGGGDLQACAQTAAAVANATFEGSADAAQVQFSRAERRLFSMAQSSMIESFQVRNIWTVENGVDAQLRMHVGPALISSSHPLFTAPPPYDAVFIEHAPMTAFVTYMTYQMDASAIGRVARGLLAGVEGRESLEPIELDVMRREVWRDSYLLVLHTDSSVAQKHVIDELRSSNAPVRSIMRSDVDNDVLSLLTAPIVAAEAQRIASSMQALSYLTEVSVAIRVIE